MGDVKKGFGKPTFIGGGVMLDPETQTYTPFRWVDGEMVKGDSVPYPETDAEMDYLQSMADGRFKPPVKDSVK